MYRNLTRATLDPKLYEKIVHASLAAGYFGERLAMLKLLEWLETLVKSEDGPTAVEYGVMMALIIVTCMLAITTLGTNTNNSFTRTGNATRITGS